MKEKEQKEEKRREEKRREEKRREEKRREEDDKTLKITVLYHLHAFVVQEIITLQKRYSSYDLSLKIVRGFILPCP
jgi:hypothetical protein